MAPPVASHSPRPLAVGVQLPEVEREVRWPEIREMATTAEDLGLDSLWVGDHLLYRPADGPAQGPWEAWSMLAALAASTSRIQIGPLVAATSFHNPAMLAKKAAAVDEISGSRLILGLGAGWNEVEYRAFGFPFDRRISRFEEAFTIIRTLLGEGSIDFSGAFYEARDCELLPRPAREGGPPLMVGSTGERMLQITLPHVQLWNAWFSAFGNDPSRYPELRAGVDAACEVVGRDPQTVARTVALLVSFPEGRGRIQGDYASAQAAIPAAELAAALRSLARDGVSHVQLVLDPITRASIEALGPVLEDLAEG